MRLLRSGAFGKHEELEPMSEWKWQQLYQISMIHGVTPWIADGIRQMSDDFFLQLSPTLRQQPLFTIAHMPSQPCQQQGRNRIDYQAEKHSS